MATRIRLQRHGRKKRPFYFIVVVDSRVKRDGKFIEKLGTFNPIISDNQVVIDEDTTIAWLDKGAKPTHTVRNILSQEGILLKRHLIGGVKKGAFDEEEMERRYNAWLEKKKEQEEAVAPVVSSAPAEKKEVVKEINLEEEEEPATPAEAPKAETSEGSEKEAEDTSEEKSETE